MRSCREMRHDAWTVLVGSRWGWRLAANYLALLAVGVGAMVALRYMFELGGIQTWESFREAQKAARQAGVDLSVPSSREALRMAFASGLSSFLEYLFSGIVAFGIALTLLKCLRNETAGWFSGAFGGFRRPLEMFWLTALMSLKVFLWTLLLVVPGFVACFRYALAWYVKAENPEMGADGCIGRSCELMRGRKAKLLRFALSYSGWIALALVPTVAAVALFAEAAHMVEGGAAPSGMDGIALLGAILVALALTSFVSIYIAVGQAVFYRDAKAEAEEGEIGAV